jgi:transaldolase
MKIFIDTARLSEIEQAYSWGIVDGVTTNPSLIKKAIDSEAKGAEMDDYIRRILKTAKGDPVSLEVIGTTEEEMFSQAMALFSKFNPVANNVVIKIPVNPSLEEKGNYDSLRVVSRLSKLNIPVNVTLVFSVSQALLAAKAGASYVSPFAGRIDDFIRAEKLGLAQVDTPPLSGEFNASYYFPKEGQEKGSNVANDEGIVSGVDLVRKILEVFSKYSLKTEVIAASLRNRRQVEEVAVAGCHIATIPFPVLEKMMVHKKTAEGMKRFVADIVPEYRTVF